MKEFDWSNKEDFTNAANFATSLWLPRADKAIVPLSWTESGRLIVCGGTRQDLIGLDSEGELKWTLGRIWEFERHYIGPSVFEYSTARFGFDPLVEQMAQSTPDEEATETQRKELRDAAARFISAREQFDQRRSTAIVAGPVVCKDGSIFVAVSNGPKAEPGEVPELAELAADCVVYQVTESGGVAALVHLPRMVTPSPWHALKRGIIWTCDNGGVVRLGIDDLDFSHGFHNTDDCLCGMRWYREYPARANKALMRADPEPAAAVFVGSTLVRTIQGAYIPKAQRTPWCGFRST